MFTLSSLQQFEVMTSDGALPLNHLFILGVVIVLHMFLLDMSFSVVVRWKGNILFPDGMANCRLVCNNETNPIFQRKNLMYGAFDAIHLRERVFNRRHHIFEILLQQRTVRLEPRPQHTDLVHDLSVLYAHCVSGLEAAAVSVSDCAVHGVPFWHAHLVEVDDAMWILAEEFRSIAQSRCQSSPVEGKRSSLAHERAFHFPVDSITSPFTLHLERFVVEHTVDNHLKWHVLAPVCCHDDYILNESQPQENVASSGANQLISFKLNPMYSAFPC